MWVFDLINNWRAAQITQVGANNTDSKKDCKWVLICFGRDS